jgi:hypothetical protein
MVLWHRLAGPLKVLMRLASNWEAVGFLLMTMEDLWCAILSVHLWGDTSILTTVAPKRLHRVGEARFSISINEWFLIQTSPKMLSLTASIGAGWVRWASPFLVLFQAKISLQASKVAEAPVLSQNLHWDRYIDPYTRDEQSNFTKWCVWFAWT